MKKVTRLQYLSLLWIARILGIFYAILLGLLALDAVKDGTDFWVNFQSLLFHLIPFLLIIVTLVFGWKRLLVSGLGFIVISVGFLMLFQNISLVNQLIVIGPGILNGLLFLVIHFIKPAVEELNKPAKANQ